MLSEISQGQKALAQRVAAIEDSLRSTADEGARVTQDLATTTAHAQPTLPPNDHLQPSVNATDVPTLDFLRSQASATQAADDYIEHLDSSVRRRIASPANARKSGRFNSSDLPGPDPMLRWPNEGTKVIAGKRKIPMMTCPYHSGSTSKSVIYYR